jgi:hypothetical protein
MRYVLLHYHIFKNAGTTVENILDRNFGEHWARFDSPDPNCRLTNAALLDFLSRNPRLMALSSHQMNYPKPPADGAAVFDLCFLRDPLDRLRSVYQFFRRDPQAGGDPLQQLARNSSLGEFLKKLVDTAPQWVNDAQVNRLAGGGLYSRPPGPRDLERAVSTVLEMSFPGVADRFNQSLVAGQYFLSPVFPLKDCSYEPANLSGRAMTLEGRLKLVRESCGRQLYQQLLDLNALDLELLRAAREEIERRFRLVPDRERRLEQLEAGIRGRAAQAVALD